MSSPPYRTLTYPTTLHPAHPHSSTTLSHPFPISSTSPRPLLLSCSTYSFLTPPISSFSSPYNYIILLTAKYAYGVRKPTMFINSQGCGAHTSSINTQDFLQVCEAQGWLTLKFAKSVIEAEKHLRSWKARKSTLFSYNLKWLQNTVGKLSRLANP